RVDEPGTAERPPQLPGGPEHLVRAPRIHRDAQHIDALVDQATRPVVIARGHEVDQSHVLVQGERMRVADHEGSPRRSHGGGEPGGDHDDAHRSPPPSPASTRRYMEIISSISRSQVRRGAAATARSRYASGASRIARRALARSSGLAPRNTSPTPRSSTTSLMSGRSAAAIGRPARMDSNSLLGSAKR